MGWKSHTFPHHMYGNFAFSSGLVALEIIHFPHIYGNFPCSAEPSAPEALSFNML